MQRFPSLVESTAHKEPETLTVLYGIGGFRHHADDRAVHLRAGFEDGAAYLEKIFHVTECLHLHGEDAVLFCAGHGGDALGDFVLHHQRGRCDQMTVVQKSEQDRAGDGVGDVAENVEFTLSGERFERYLEEVAFDEFDLRVLLADEPRQLRVFLDGGE